MLHAAMINTIKNTYRLTKAGATLAWHGVAFVPESVTLPGPLRVLRGTGDDIPFAKRKKKASASPKRFRALGPTYIKLGQFLATRPDVVGPQLANALGSLRDRLPPFSIQEAHQEIEAAFGKPWNEIYEDFGPPIAAASIAQVHKASSPHANRAARGGRQGFQASHRKALRARSRELLLRRACRGALLAADAPPPPRRRRGYAGAVGGAGDGLALEQLPSPRSPRTSPRGATSGSGCPTSHHRQKRSEER